MCVPMCLLKTEGGIIHACSLEEARIASFRRKMVFFFFFFISVMESAHTHSACVGLHELRELRHIV